MPLAPLTSTLGVSLAGRKLADLAGPGMPHLETSGDCRSNGGRNPSPHVTTLKHHACRSCSGSAMPPVASSTHKQAKNRVVAHHIFSQMMSTAVLLDGAPAQSNCLQTALHPRHEILHSYETTQLRINTIQITSMGLAKPTNT